jgi:hypothetical protein
MKEKTQLGFASEILNELKKYPSGIWYRSLARSMKCDVSKIRYYISGKNGYLLKNNLVGIKEVGQGSRAKLIVLKKFSLSKNHDSEDFSNGMFSLSASGLLGRPEAISVIKNKKGGFLE